MSYGDRFARLSAHSVVRIPQEKPVTMYEEMAALRKRVHEQEDEHQKLVTRVDERIEETKQLRLLVSTIATGLHAEIDELRLRADTAPQYQPKPPLTCAPQYQPNTREMSVWIDGPSVFTWAHIAELVRAARRKQDYPLDPVVQVDFDLALKPFEHVK